MSAISRYCQMWTTWREGLPDDLAAESPGFLSDFLRLASRESGISRSELERELKLKQPRVSKLSTKLMNEKWLEIVPRSKGAVHVELIRATPLAKSAMAKLEASLESLSPRSQVPPAARSAAPRRRGLQTPANAIGTTFS